MTAAPSPPRFRDQHLPIALTMTGMLILALLVSTFTPIKVLDGGWEIGLIVLGIVYLLLILHYLQRRWLFRHGVNVLAELAASSGDSLSIRYRHAGETFERIVELTPDARTRVFSGKRIVLRMHPRCPKCVQYLREFDTPEILASLASLRFIREDRP